MFVRALIFRFLTLLMIACLWQPALIKAQDAVPFSPESIGKVQSEFCVDGLLLPPADSKGLQDGKVYTHSLPEAAAFCKAATCKNLIALNEAVRVKGASPVKSTNLVLVGPVAEYCKEQQSLVDSNDSVAQQASIRKKIADASQPANCVRVDSPDGSFCTGQASQELKELQNAVYRGFPIAVFREPVGSESIFNVLRLCETEFIRNSRGDLQRVDGGLDSGKLNGFYTIRNTGNCQEYVVDQCDPNDIISFKVWIEDGKMYSRKSANDTLGDPLPGLPIVSYCSQVQMLWDTSGAGLLKSYVGFIYRWAAGFIGVVAVVVVMLSGIQISMAGGDSGVVDTAKERIQQSLIALALLFLSGIILYAINPFYFRARPEMRVEDPLPAAEEQVQPAVPPVDHTDGGSVR